MPKPARRLAKSSLHLLFRSARFLAGSRPAAVQAVRFSVPGHESFVGYYDIQPASPDGGAILAHVTAVARRRESAGDTARLGYFEREGRSFIEVAHTELWCWQLGARLRWWPGERRALAFNSILDGSPSYCIAAEGRRPVRLCDRPLFDVSADGRLGLALNFGRLASARPGYGYPTLADPFAGISLPEGDGIGLADLATGRTELVVPLGAIARLADDACPEMFHYLNGASLSPAGSRFSVLHFRLASTGRTTDWRVDAVVGRTDGTDLRRLSLPGAPSHYWWLDEDRVAFTCNSAAGYWQSRYVLFDLRDGSVSPLHPAAPGMDGHPSLHRGTKRWITDHYPDLYGEQALYVLEPNGSQCEIARFPADPRYRDEWRCDLHPRWCADGKSVVVDSTHEGFRAIYDIEVPEPA